MNSGGPSQPPRSLRNRSAMPIFPAPRRDGLPAPPGSDRVHPPMGVGKVFHNPISLLDSDTTHAMQWEAPRAAEQGGNEVSAPSAPEPPWAALLSASELTDIISASWAAFECIWLYADKFADQVTGHFATWMAVAAPTCGGRDALGRAPSMPTPVADAGPRFAEEGEDAAARLVAELAAILEQRLGAAVRQATRPEDARACAQAAQAAAEIRELFAGA